jgi:hypothetical protein
MEQMMEQLLAEIQTNREEMKAMMVACTERLEANQEKLETEEAYPERLQTNQEKVEDDKELETNQEGERP